LRFSFVELCLQYWNNYSQILNLYERKYFCHFFFNLSLLIKKLSFCKKKQCKRETHCEANRRVCAFNICIDNYVKYIYRLIERWDIYYIQTYSWLMQFDITMCLSKILKYIIDFSFAQLLNFFFHHAALFS
jgi:hypothetical protein